MQKISNSDFRFVSKVDIRFQNLDFEVIKRNLIDYKFSRIALIVDSKVNKLKKVSDLILEFKNNFSSTIFINDAIEPDYNFLEQKRYEFSPETDCILAIGGGSTMDLAKGLAVLIVNDGPSIEYKGFPRLKNKPIPVITIPTLAGTGSEIAYNAVFTDSDKRMRLGINSELNYPIFCIIDPELSLSAPRSAVISGILDCLNHIIEGFISNNSTIFSRQISKSAFELWYSSVILMRSDFSDLNSRRKMYMASIFANQALNNVGSGLGGDFSYPLGALYGVPHGLGEGIFLPYLYRLYVDRGFSDFSDLYDSISNKESGLSVKGKSLKFCELLEELYGALDVPTHLNEFGIDRSMISILVDQVRSSFDSAPVEFNEIDAHKLFEHFIK